MLTEMCVSHVLKLKKLLLQYRRVRARVFGLFSQFIPCTPCLNKTRLMHFLFPIVMVDMVLGEGYFLKPSNYDWISADHILVMICHHSPSLITDITNGKKPIFNMV